MSILDQDAVAYRVITETDRDELQIAVNDAIRNGWQPCGGVSITFRPVDNNGMDTSYLIYSQAVIPK